MSDPRERAFARRIIAERQKLQAFKLDLENLSFPEQANFIRDPSKRKAALCTRRAGKTESAAIMLVESALKNPKTTSVYCGFTRFTAKETIWEPLIRFLTKAEIPFTENLSELSLKLPNDSKITIQGADKPGEIRKLRGRKLPLAVLDECGHADFANELENIVNAIIGPLLIQYHGTLVLLGTPGIDSTTLFYKITNDQNPLPGWSVHKWSWKENTTTEPGHGRICDLVQEYIDEQTKDEPTWFESPDNQREYFGKWVLDSSSKVYKYSPANLIASLPPNNYKYIISVDPAATDGTAFLVAASAPSEFFIVESFKIKDLDISAVANQTKQLANYYSPIAAYVFDGANKMALLELNSRHHIPFQATPKSPNYKPIAIGLMNGDFRQAKIKIVESKNQDLIKELSKLIWDPHNPKLEKQSLPNDLCDAALYAWIKSRHYLKPHTPTNPINDPNDAPPRYKPLLDPDQLQDHDIFDSLDIDISTFKRRI